MLTVNCSYQFINIYIWEKIRLSYLAILLKEELSWMGIHLKRI